MNKRQLLENISEESIFEYIFGHKINLHDKYKAPYREDKTGSCSFWYNREGKLKFIDPSYGLNEDCFGVYMRIHQCSFSEAIKRIAEEVNVNEKVQREYKKIQNNFKREYKYELENWNDVNLAYWKNNSISIDTLIHFKVYPLKTLYVNNNLAYTNAEEPSGYMYNFNPAHNIYAFYFPLRQKGIKYKPRFIKNYLYLEGYRQFLSLPNKMQQPIFTKSYKDVMSFYEIGKKNVIAHPSEKKSFTQRGLKIWQTSLEIINESNSPIISVDNDESGNRFYKELLEEINNKNFTRFNQYAPIKDFADYMKINGKEKAKDLYYSIYKQ